MKNQKLNFQAMLKKVFSVVLFLSISMLAEAEGDGYGANNGGNGGTQVTVTTASQLSQYAGSNSAYVITVSGTINLGTNGKVSVGSNTTIQGANSSATILGTLTISGKSNVIIKYLNISANTGSAGSNDGVQVQGGSQGVLITKCNIYDCTDGNLDVTHGGGTVTVSWCKFYYTRDNGHNFSNLIGASDDDYGTYNTTWHHNWWAQGCQQRMMATRFGPCHIYNNYWNSSGNDYCTTSRNVCEMRSQNNYYDGVEDPLAKEQSGKLNTSGNIFNNCSGSQTSSSDAVFTPPYSYSLTATSSVPSVVKAGAGNVGSGGSSSNYYNIQNRHSSKCMRVENSSSSNNAYIIQETCNTSYYSMQFELMDAGDSYLYIKNRATNKCMRAVNGYLVQYDCNTGWWSEMFSRQNVGSGYYLIQNRSTGTCLRVENSSTANGARFVLETCNTGWYSQQFSFPGPRSASDESIETIKPVSDINIYPNPSYSGRFTLDISGIEVKDNVNIEVYSFDGKSVYVQEYAGKTEISPDLSLNKGIYMVVVKNGNQTLHKKLVVQ